MKRVFFDLETQNLLQDVGGRAHIDRLRLSCAVTYAEASAEYTVYWEADAGALLDELRAADQVVGFNLLAFDYQVLRPYAPGFDFAALRTLDLLREIQRILGFRLSLDAIASATLGSAKLADGRQAVAWYRSGALEQLAAYCRQDVAITREVFEFGREYGYVMYRSRLGSKLRVQVNWR